MNILKKLFPRYLQSKEESLSAEEYADFSDKAKRLVNMIFWTLLTCIVILLVRTDPSKSSRLTGKQCGFAIVMPIFCIEILSLFRKFFVYIKGDAGEKMNWTTAVLVTSLMSVVTAVIAVNDMIDMFTPDRAEINRKEQTFVYEDVGMKVTVPAGYSDITYEDVGTENSVRWYVENETNVIWVYIYNDWSFTSTYENADGEIRSVLETHFDRFVVSDKVYFKGGFLSEPEMIEINSQAAFMSFGKRDTDNDYRFIIYRFLRNDALICVTYAFSPALDQEGQKQIAYEFVSNMEFK